MAPKNEAFLLSRYLGVHILLDGTTYGSNELTAAPQRQIYTPTWIGCSIRGSDKGLSISIWLYTPLGIASSTQELITHYFARPFMGHVFAFSYDSHFS